MDIAVFSDIHGNYVAFERCITYAIEKKIHTFVFLGDYLGEFAYPQKTMKLIYELKEQYQCYFIKGNKEEYWLNYRACGEKGWNDYNSTTGCLFYVYQFLTNRDFDFFASLPIAKEITLNTNVPITICHGSPRKVNQKLRSDDPNTYEIMELSTTNIILCGHTHIQEKIEHNNKIILNAGSIGMPLLGGGTAQFLILHVNNKNVKEEFISLNYDVERVIRELDEEQLNVRAPYWIDITKAILRGGKISHGTVLNKAMELCYKETGKCEWPNIPEKYWKEAFQEYYLDKNYV